MRVDIMWNAPTPYLAACLEDLREVAEINLTFGREADKSLSAVEDSPLYPNVISYRRTQQSRILGFPSGTPDLLLVCGWRNPRFLLRALRFRGRTTRVLTMDNTWQSSRRQKLAQYFAPMIRPLLFESIWVPGLPQDEFARRLGFKSSNRYQGSYACDVRMFRSAKPVSSNRTLLFVGRLVGEKGIEILLQAHSMHQAQCREPLELLIVGDGPLRTMEVQYPHVRFYGAASSMEIRDLMSSARALVLPSLTEPWGVVVHEACAAGLPVITSSACGSRTKFVTSGNGWTVETGSVVGLATAINQLASTSSGTWETMSEASRRLAESWTPRDWSSQLVRMMSRLV